MNQSLALVALVVRDYDEAIRYFTQTLDFELTEDSDRGGGKRWVTVTPRGGGSTGLLLARAASDRQSERVGDQTGGRVGFFLETDDFERDHALYVSRGVTFLEAPRHEPYGSVAVFEDLYGNMWDLIQPRA